MEMRCPHVSADEAGDEMFQVLFGEKRELLDGAYLLISRAFFEEDEGLPSPIYVETHDEQMVGHYPKVGAELTRDRLTLRLPSPANETIVVDFTTSDKNFQRLVSILGVILQETFPDRE